MARDTPASSAHNERLRATIFQDEFLHQRRARGQLRLNCKRGWLHARTPVIERSAAAERLSDVTASCDDRDLQKALLSIVILQDLDAGQP